MNADPIRAEFQKIKNRVVSDTSTSKDAHLLLEMVLDYRKRIHKQACKRMVVEGDLRRRLARWEGDFRMVREAIDPSDHGCQWSYNDVYAAVFDPERIAHLRLRVAEAWINSLGYQPVYAHSKWRAWLRAAQRVAGKYLWGAK